VKRLSGSGAGARVAADWLLYLGAESADAAAVFQKPPVAATLPADHADYRIFHEADWYAEKIGPGSSSRPAASVYWVVRNGLFPMTPGRDPAQFWSATTTRPRFLPTIDLVESDLGRETVGGSAWYVPFMAMSNAWFSGCHRDFRHTMRTKGDFKGSTPSTSTAPPIPANYSTP